MFGLEIDLWLVGVENLEQIIDIVEKNMWLLAGRKIGIVEADWIADKKIVEMMKIVGMMKIADKKKIAEVDELEVLNLNIM